MNTRYTLLIGALLLTQFSAAQSQFGGPVQFYFSTPGGDNTRLESTLVDSPNWTGEFDVVVRNTGQASIQFTSAPLHVGFGRALAYGSAATPITGSDLIRERVAFPQFQLVRDNANITWRPDWSPGTTQSILGGGFFDPLGGPERPWGLSYAITTANQAPAITLGPGESIALSRVALRDNGLHSRGGSFDLVLHRWPFAQLGANALFRPTGVGSDAVYYWDPGDYVGNSRLTLMTPEPVTLGVLIVGVMAVALRRGRRQ